MADVYRIVAGRSNVCFEVNGSELISYVSSAEMVEGAKTFVTEIEERHPDMTHNVPVYRVPVGSASSLVPSEGNVMLREYQSDDGEPSGSSGKPVLNALVQRNARNVAAVVTRYHDDTNLGIGGLTRVYSRAAKEALNVAGVVEGIPHERFIVTVEYDGSGSVCGLLESVGVEFEAVYEADVSSEIRIPIEDGLELRDRIRSAISGCANIE